ncbi:helix-turn-helix transcriptional regulator [Pseudomonas aeruginosa]
MQKSTIKPGRPSGTPTYESEAASAFGQAVRAARVAQGIAQDVFASRAGVSRSHMGKIERGEHVPTLPLILKVSTALRISAAELMAATERNLGAETDN